MLTTTGLASYMHSRTHTTIKLALLLLLTIGFGSPKIFADDNGNAVSRRTAIVDAVQSCQASVVNLRGRKTVKAEGGTNGQAKKQVNGMGTGIVIDSRGYVLTNYHVVQGVRTIEVTTNDRQKTTAKLLAHDPETDLAILKINTRTPLPPIRIGTCLLYTSPSPRDQRGSRMPSSA